MRAFPQQGIKSGWKRRRLGHLIQFRNGKDTKSVEAADGAHPVYGSGGEFKRADAYLYDGPSILFGRKGTLDKPLLVHGKFWTVDTMFYTIPGPEVDPKFVHYWALTVPYQVLSTDTAVPSMTSTDLGQLHIHLPKLETQRAIADYLDRETAEIDAMTADLDKMEKLLTERRAEILRSWFGEQLKNPRAPLATIAELYIGKMEQPRKKSVDEIYAPFFHSANIRPGGMIDLECSVKHMWFRPDELNHMLLRKGDVVVVEGGAAGRPGYIAKSVDGWGIQKSVIRARPFEDKVIGKYLFYALTFAFEDGQFDLQASLATLAHFPAEKAARFRVPVRSLADQELVVARLDRDLSSLSDMLADITELRDLLAERRAAVIAAAVTGQIDIPVAEETTHA
ncbi:restriction endonuclease subunit S [Corynebacterium macclintockiae]|uniref:restriction endonuclease subunit S n=1 Tax=Corynebacterium macclintockiae TaxID=2913501 RepID=UPI003EBCCB0C